MGIVAKRCITRHIPKVKSMYQIEKQYLDDISFQMNGMYSKTFDFQNIIS